MYTGNIGGPINKRSSFFVDFMRRQITDNALVNAVYLDPATLTAAKHPAGHRDAQYPDHDRARASTISSRPTTPWSAASSTDGIRGTTAASAATACRRRLPTWDTRSSGNNQNLMLTETSILNAHTVNETRFQYSRNFTRLNGNLEPQINVAGAFITGGNNMGVAVHAQRALRTAEPDHHLARRAHDPLRHARAARRIDHGVARGLRRHVLVRRHDRAAAGRQQSTGDGRFGQCGNPADPEHRAVPPDAALPGARLRRRPDPRTRRHAVAVSDPGGQSVRQHRALGHRALGAGRLAHPAELHVEPGPAVRVADAGERRSRHRSAHRIRLGSGLVQERAAEDGDPRRLRPVLRSGRAEHHTASRTC